MGFIPERLLMMMQQQWFGKTGSARHRLDVDLDGSQREGGRVQVAIVTATKNSGAS